MTLITYKNYKNLQHKISKNAIKVIYRLKKTGYQAYLVGGSVRDLILGSKPKDFDITTNATPEQLRKIFRNCRLVGKRFRIAHIMFQSEFIEVSTFRGSSNKKIQYQKNKKIKKTINGMLLTDNIFGSIEEDAQRRDITINTLYYDISNSVLRDYVGGIKDLKKKTIRLIGDPETRYREDPIRILRVIRFAVILKMKISKKTEEPISRLANLLQNIPPSRLFCELIKLIQTGEGLNIYKKLKKYQLIQTIFLFPKIIFKNETKRLTKIISIKAIKLIDKKIKEQKKNGNNIDFLFSAMLWYLLIEKTKTMKKEKNIQTQEAFLTSINEIFKHIVPCLKIPKQVILNIKEIWKLQTYLELKSITNNLKKIINKKNFFQANELLVLRAETEQNERLYNLSIFWNKKTHN